MGNSLFCSGCRAAASNGGAGHEVLIASGYLFSITVGAGGPKFSVPAAKQKSYTAATPPPEPTDAAEAWEKSH